MVRTLAKAWLVPHQPHSTPVTHFHTAVTHILRYLTVIRDATRKWGESYFPGEANESLIYFFLFLGAGKRWEKEKCLLLYLLIMGSFYPGTCYLYMSVFFF